MSPFVADPEWGWWIIGYFYLGGIAAGAYFVATLVDLVGRPEDRAISRLGYRLALPLVSLCGILLIVDLDRPERFWHMLLQSEIVAKALADGWPLGGWGTMVRAAQLKWWSPMSIGAWALLLFSLCSALSFLGSLRPGGWLERRLAQGILGRLFQLTGTGAGFFLASYTGVLLTATNQPLWGVSSWIGPLFLTSAASTGIAALLLLPCRGGAIAPATLERLEHADLWALGLEVLVFLLFLASVGSLLPVTLHTWAGVLLVVGTPLVGLLLPLVFVAWGQGTAAACCALLGGFLLRYGILGVAPALLDRAADLANVSPEPLWQSALGKGLVILAVVLVVAVPWFLRRTCQLSARGTAVLAVAAVAVAVGVVGYVVAPGPTPLPLAHFSPEEARPRGGGSGASAGNRPETTPQRSKINGTLPDEP
jgi:formate-dependent nitrite reductase membrane component NrfD